MHLKERKREKVLFLCLTVKSEAVLSLCGGKNILTSLYFKGIVRAKSGHFFLKLRKVTHLYSDSCYIVFIKDRRMKDHENIQLHLIRFFFSLKMTLTCRRWFMKSWFSLLDSVLTVLFLIDGPVVFVCFCLP